MFLSIIDPCRERPINLLPRTLSYSPRGPSRRDPGDEVERPILETREFWKRVLRLDWTENSMKHTLSRVWCFAWRSLGVRLSCINSFCLLLSSSRNDLQVLSFILSLLVCLLFLQVYRGIFTVGVRLLVTLMRKPRSHFSGACCVTFNPCQRMNTQTTFAMTDWLSCSTYLRNARWGVTAHRCPTSFLVFHQQVA